jgi:hypothetical protein
LVVAFAAFVAFAGAALAWAALAWVACGFAAAEAAVLAAAATLAEATVSDAVPPAGLICADDAVGAAMAGELAAMAAAAIASGAVLLPDAVTPVVAELAGGVEGTFVETRTTGITTAIAFGTTAAPPCWAARFGSVDEPLSEDGCLSEGFAVPPFGVSALALDGWPALAPAPAFAALLASEACPEAVLGLLESLAAWLAVAASEGCVLFCAVDGSSARRGAGVWVWLVAAALLLLAAAVLLSTNAPNPALACDGSVLAKRWGAL